MTGFFDQECDFCSHPIEDASSHLFIGYSLFMTCKWKFGKEMKPQHTVRIMLVISNFVADSKLSDSFRRCKASCLVIGQLLSPSGR